MPDLVIAMAWQEIGTGGGTSLLQPILNVGAVGAILWWFMTRLERFIHDNTKALDRLTRSNLLLVISMPSTTPRAKEQARNIMAELERDTGERLDIENGD